MSGDILPLCDVAAEEAWLKLSTTHFTAREWEASKQAADISDRIRWYRLHLRCAALSPSGERCKYRRGHDATGEPHSWTLFGFGGPGR